MKRFRWQIIAGFILIGISCLVYLIHYAIFRDTHHIFVFMLGNLAFLPAKVLIATIIIDQLLKAREKKAMLNKLNMAIGIFFSKMGITLLKMLSLFDRSTPQKRERFIFTNDWDGGAFREAAANTANDPYDIDTQVGGLKDLEHLLNNEKNFLLTLLGNSNLLEHERFTDLLWAVTHLSEELSSRADLGKLSEADGKHIANDIKRAYTLLLAEWFTYMEHLRHSYPYLFSLAVRTNPFDPKAKVEF